MMNQYDSEKEKRCLEQVESTATVTDVPQLYCMNHRLRTSRGNSPNVLGSWVRDVLATWYREGTSPEYNWEYNAEGSSK
jgi:hypothetical protein